MKFNRLKLPPLVSSALLTIAMLAPLPVSADVLTFDDLPDSTDASPEVPDGYGGINWSAGGWNYFGELQAPYTAHSGENRAYSYHPDNKFSFIGNPVILDGAWFAGGSNYDDGTPTNDKVTMDLYYKGLLVGQSSALSVSIVPTFLTSGYSGYVDAVAIAETVLRPTNTDFVMDDVTYHAADIPEPTSIGLFTITIFYGGLLSIRRHRAKRRSKSAGVCAALSESCRRTSNDVAAICQP